MSEPFQKRRGEAAIDACAVWAALFLTYVSVGLLLGWRLVRALRRVLKMRGAEPEI